MRLTKLRLNGFKSFVDPTDLVIAEGLTGIVGPNGCGKSNLLEAMRWVMGENRPKAMRGGGMEDVIFAGAASRPARNFAEVTLTIDNSERLAPASFNDSDTLEITRRITRDVGSAYMVNGKDVRARDVQMLFADASTGAHSPALVRQGQIAELINARPKARRRILEEAAGISGLYQRRHEAELKLRGAESNLLRIDDVIEQLAQQLAQLARQARQAARYRAIGEELRRAEGMLLIRRWHEAEQALAETRAQLGAQTAAAAKAERLASEAARERGRREEALPPLREEEAIASALLQRLQVERTKLDESERHALASIEALEARIAQLENDRAREEALNRDAGETIARLEAEEQALIAAAEGHEERLEAAAGEAREAAAILQQREEALSTLTEDAARLAAQHQSARRLLEETRKILERAEAGREKATREAAEAEAELAEARKALESARAEQQRREREAEAAEAALARADEARASAQSREADARAARSEAEGEQSALQAEMAALARMVEREAAEGSQLLDSIRVSPGHEKALGAALADDLRAPLTTPDGITGWAELPAYETPQPLPAGIAPLAAHVSGPAALNRRLSQIGIVDPDMGNRLQEALLPGQRLVSLEGDLWRWDGYRASAEDAPSAAALRLAQINRLQELRQDLEEASARAEGAARAHEHLRQSLAEATEADRAAREARRKADLAMAEASRALSRAEAACNIAESRLDALRLAARRHDEEAIAARTRLREAEAALKQLDDLEAVRAEMEDVKLTVEAARMTMLAKRSAHDEMRREEEARQRRLGEVRQELRSWRSRLETAGRRMAELESRRESAQAELDTARTAPDEIRAAREKLAGQIEAAEARRRAAADALAEAEAALREAVQAERDAERAASTAREARAAAEARAEAAEQGVSQAEARIREEMETPPRALFESLGAALDDMPAAERLEAEVGRLRRQRDALGAINLRAEEDAREVQREHDEMLREKEDLEGAIAKLRSGIAALNREGRERLLTAFEQVNENFSLLFRHLFGGGEAKLILVESDDPLEAGLEIMCQPPGKKLSTLSLLSGGEQTLTALALIFAVFRANPAPICVLDEVDAPLDDANVTRFCDLLDEMVRQTRTRFMIITHHAITMARMNRLFGVTMAEQGVSQLVSVDLQAAERMVA